MSRITIYHNPRCTKSRQTLALLHEQGLEPEVIEYLREPPDEQTISNLLEQLGMQAADLIRDKEHRSLGLQATEEATELIARMAAHPEIIQRPIVVCNGKAKLGRPPEGVLDIL